MDNKLNTLIGVDFFAQNNAEYLKCVVEEMKLLQDIIKRMANNSFLIKAWTVSIVMISLIFKSELESYAAIICGIIVVITFWFLDAYFLKSERRFRHLSENLVILRKDINSIDVKPLFCFKFINLDKQIFLSVVKLMWSFQLLLFYSIVVIMLLISRLPAC